MGTNLSIRSFYESSRHSACVDFRAKIGTRFCCSYKRKIKIQPSALRLHHPPFLFERHNLASRNLPAPTTVDRSVIRQNQPPHNILLHVFIFGQYFSLCLAHFLLPLLPESLEHLHHLLECRQIPLVLRDPQFFQCPGDSCWWIPHAQLDRHDFVGKGLIEPSRKVCELAEEW